MSPEKFQKTARILLSIIALSFIPTLFFSYVNEEAILTISSLEMHYHHSYLIPTFMGINYWRPPLFNWCIILMAKILGWQNALIGQRLIAASATLATAFLLFQLSKSLSKNIQLSYIITLVFLTSDALFYDGWIATTDPLYSFFCFGAIAFIWLSFDKEKISYFFLASLCVIIAYITKALTVYYVYATSLIILSYYYRNKLKSICTIYHIATILLALSFPLIWSHIAPQPQGQNMLWDVNHQLNFPLNLTTLWNLSSFLIQYILKFSMSLLFFYFLIKKDFKNYKNFANHQLAFLALTIALVNFFPYWIFPERHEIRYTILTYPLISMFMGIFLWNLHKEKLILIFTGICIIAKYLFCLGFFLNQHYLYDQYQQTANTILTDTQNEKLYYQDTTSIGQSELAYIDLTLYPQAPLINPASKNAPYFIVKYPPEDCPNELNPNKDLYKIYNLGHSQQHIYLYKIP